MFLLLCQETYKRRALRCRALFLLYFENDLAVLCGRIDSVAALYLTFQHIGGESILNETDDGAAKGARSVNLVKALAGKQQTDTFVKRNINAKRLNASPYLCEHDLGDGMNILVGELIEDNDIVNAVKKLGAEGLLQCIHDTLAVLPFFIFGVGLAEAECATVANARRARIGGHNDDRVFKVYASPL